MNIGIDARFVGPEGTGLGKYTEKLILNLARLDRDNQYTIFLRKSNWDYLHLPKNFQRVLADVKWYTIKEQLEMPKLLKNLDVLHVPHFNIPLAYKGPLVVTIHDLIHHHFSEKATTTKNPIIFKLKRAGYKYLIKKAISNSKKIITPSNFVKEEIVNTFGVDESKIVVTYEAAEEEYFANNKQETINNKLLEKYQIKKPFILYVGNAYPHKNLEILLKAVKTLILHPRGVLSKSSAHPGGESKLNLVIVCPRDVFASRLQNKIESLHLEEQVTVTGYITADELPQIFKQSEAYVFPSLAEGFGIPGLNAMAAGIPVVSSNIPTLKEVYGNAAAYFDPTDPEDIKAKIHQVVSSDKTRTDLVKKGKERVKKYSWEKMAKETIKVYESAARINLI